MERVRHEQTHLPCKSWCKFCAMGRGRQKRATTGNRAGRSALGSLRPLPVCHSGALRGWGTEVGGLTHGSSRRDVAESPVPVCPGRAAVSVAGIQRRRGSVSDSPIRPDATPWRSTIKCSAVWVYPPWLRTMTTWSVSRLTSPRVRWAQSSSTRRVKNNCQTSIESGCLKKYRMCCVCI